LLTIDMQHIEKSYLLGKHEHLILKEVNFSVKQSELVAIMGASGSGKSTLMQIIGLLDRPTAGSYLLNGKEVSQLSDDERASIRNTTMGFVFQSFFLLPRLTVLQNVALPIQYNAQLEQHSDYKERCDYLLTRVGMQDHAKKKPYQLSGGQQQRVAIARALVMSPAVILADEPTGALDSRTGQEVMELFISLNREEKATIVVITHDEKIAQACHRLVRIHDGSIVPETCEDAP